MSTHAHAASKAYTAFVAVLAGDVITEAETVTRIAAGTAAEIDVTDATVTAGRTA